ncbi:MAG: exopolysaccharide biosynthesis protein [Halioglobus sp.]|nr:exopolysaccharide biosynthesis protein [Halioglobus sp.]
MTFSEAVGVRSFSPMLTLVGLLLVSPLSGIPFFPTICAIIVLLVSMQLLMGRTHIWLPQMLSSRSVPAEQLRRAIDWLMPGARFVDRYTGARLTVLVAGPARFLIAGICVFLATMMPLMEFIPFSSSLAGIALCAFGLSLLAYDGVLSLVAHLVTGAVGWLVISAIVQSEQLIAG